MSSNIFVFNILTYNKNTTIKNSSETQKNI